MTNTPANTCYKYTLYFKKENSLIWYFIGSWNFNVAVAKELELQQLTNTVTNSLLMVSSLIH